MLQQIRARNFGMFDHVCQWVVSGLGLAQLGSTFETLAALSPGSIRALDGSIPGAITLDESSDRATVAIPPASGHTMALLSTRSLMAGGKNFSGRLGPRNPVGL
jgi:hypothetical protein